MKPSNTQSNTQDGLDIHFRFYDRPKRLTFTQKVALLHRMVEILKDIPCEHAQSTSEKLQATLKGMSGIRYTGWEAGRKEYAYELAKFQLEQEGVF